MPEKMRFRLGGICLLLGLAATMFILMLTALHAVGTDGGLYFELQSRERRYYSVAEPWGVADETLRTLDGRLAAYLAGDAKALEGAGGEGSVVEIEVFGAPQPAFNGREMAHLEDCYGLFALLRKVRGRLVAWAVLLTVGGAYLLRDRRRVRRCAWLSPLILLVPLGAFAACALSDFDGAFTLFHRALFSNDLWLLDPATDLLIRICPERMFMAMGARIGLWSLAALIAVPLAATALTWIWPREKGEDSTWSDRDMRRGSAQKRISFDRRDGR